MAVLDANILIALTMPDPGHAIVRAQWERWARIDEQLHAPDVLPFEVANVLARRIALGEMQLTEVEPTWAAIKALEIEIHTFDLIRDGPRVVAIAASLQRRHATDCVYVNLAERLGETLWTLDGPFARVAQQAGYPVRLLT